MSASNTSEHLKNLSIAAVSAIPIVGGPVSVLMDKYLPEYLERRRLEFWNALDHDLVALNARGAPVQLSTDRFISVFMKAFKLALEENEKVKIEAFKNIIVNSALPGCDEFDETTLFLKWVADLTADQIRVLKEIKDSDRFEHEDQSDLYYVLKDAFPTVPRDYLMICAQEIVNRNIVTYGMSHRSAELGNPKEKKWYLTELGARFVSFIESPVTHGQGEDHTIQDA